MDFAMDHVKAGCEPFSAEGSGPRARTGVLLIHGYTGSPDSMRPWGIHLNELGYKVDVIRLPGHGTTWQDANKKTHADLQAEANRVFDELRQSTDRVFIMAQSYGSTLALRIAAERPDEVAGLVLVNPWVRPDGVAGWQRHLVPFQGFIGKLVKSVPGVGSDIADPKGRELAYDRVPVVGATALAVGWKELQPMLAHVVAPVLLFRSLTDHVLSPNNSELLRAQIRSPLQEIELQRSYHVATLDYDAKRIFEGSVEFIESLSESISQDQPDQS